MILFKLNGTIFNIDNFTNMAHYLYYISQFIGNIKS